MGEEFQGKEGMSWMELSTGWRAPRWEVLKPFPRGTWFSNGVIPAGITHWGPEAFPPCTLIMERQMPSNNPPS